MQIQVARGSCDFQGVNRISKTYQKKIVPRAYPGLLSRRAFTGGAVIQRKKEIRKVKKWEN